MLNPVFETIDHNSGKKVTHKINVKGDLDVCLYFDKNGDLHPDSWICEKGGNNASGQTNIK